MENKIALYIIELQPDKDPNAQWYVGITNDMSRRFSQHTDNNKNGSYWTERNEIVDTYPIGTTGRRRMAKRMENHLTEFLMQEFGINSVRGGDYTYETIGDVPELGDILSTPTET
ncbi:MAG: GIY-YIG nuclease family protein [Halorhabdus sp.]